MKNLNHVNKVWIALVLVLLLGGNELSSSVFDDISIHGFLSQGMFLSSKNNYLPNSQDATFELNEIAFSLSKQITPKLRVGLQLLSRDYGDLGNNDVDLDWGFADYRFSDFLGIRMGKIKLPYSLYNESRDIDQARTMIMLPQSIYDDTRRDIFVGYQGIGLYGNLSLKSLGSLEYNAGTGSNRFKPDAVFLRYFAAIWNKTMIAMGLPSRTIMGLDMTTKSFFVGQIIWNTPLEGLRLGYSRIEFKGKVNQVNGPSSIGDWQHNRWFTVSAEYVVGNLTLASEYGETNARITLFGVPVFMDKVQQSWYVMGAYQILPSLSVSVLYDIYYADKEDRDGLYYIASGLPAYMGWRKDLGIGLRYDVNRHMTLKAEMHFIDGAALFLSNYNSPYDPSTGMTRIDLERKWTLFGLKASYSF